MITLKSDTEVNPYGGDINDSDDEEEERERMETAYNRASTLVMEQSRASLGR